jgi:histidyl-tRNA synthetase
MKKADTSGASFAVIIGDDEANAGEVSLKPLRASGDGSNDQKREQKRVAVDRIADEIMNSFLDGEET